MADNQSEIVKKMVEDFVCGHDMELVDFKCFLSNGRYSVRCFIDHPCGGITLEECAQINREIFSFIEANNFLGDDFVVEVNSPGLDRPLKTQNDFIRVKGKTVLLWLHELVNNKSYYEGEVGNSTGEGVSIETKTGCLTVAYRQIKLCKEKINYE